MPAASSSWTQTGAQASSTGVSTPRGALPAAVRFKDALTDLEELLDSQPAAEELASSWYSQKRSTAATSGVKGKGKAGAASWAGPETKARLQDLILALDSGRRAPVPIPMRIAVLALKASWHADGTWPLLGSDEALSSIVDDLTLQSRVTTGPTPLPAPTPVDLPHSIHPSTLLLRPPGQSNPRIPRPDLDDGPRAIEDPGPDLVADVYRQRGIAVDEAVVGNF